MREGSIEQASGPVALLAPGQTFPTWTVSTVGGGTLTLPEDLKDGWAVVLFYRGHWCPYCRSQLVDFQASLDAFEERGIRVVALSVDMNEEAELTVERHGLEFPVAFGIDPRRARETLGTYLGPDDSYVQATGFILSAGGEVQLAVYSSGAVGRLVAKDVIGVIDYTQSQE